MPGPTLVRWPKSEPPTEAAIEAIFRREGLTPHGWSNGPGDRYGSHAHPYHKILYCVRGSISFVAEGTGEPYDLGPGDRLEIPPSVAHSAVVGPEGVACLEAARA